MVNDATSLSAIFPALAPGALYDVTAANATSCSDTLVEGMVRGFHGRDRRPISSTTLSRRSSGTAITAGCSGRNYCPNNPVTRAQMAVFLIKAKYNLSLVPPPATGTLFADVPAGAFAADLIEQLAGEGVTGGCGGGSSAPATRSPASRWLSFC